MIINVIINIIVKEFKILVHIILINDYYYYYFLYNISNTRIEKKPLRIYTYIYCVEIVKHTPYLFYYSNRLKKLEFMCFKYRQQFYYN